MAQRKDEYQEQREQQQPLQLSSQRTLLQLAMHLQYAPQQRHFLFQLFVCYTSIYHNVTHISFENNNKKKTVIYFDMKNILYIGILPCINCAVGILPRAQNARRVASPQNSNRNRHCTTFTFSIFFCVYILFLCLMFACVCVCVALCPCFIFAEFAFVLAVDSKVLYANSTE